jgi:hypothetical protein
MQMTWIGLAIIAATATLSSSAAAVEPGKVQTFKNWTVGCDNGLACQAVALPDSESDEGNVSIVVSRSADADTELTLDLPSSTLQAGKYQVRVDGKPVLDITVPTADTPAQFRGVSALKVLRAMAQGNDMQLQDQRGVQLGKASLAGASAAFRYIDAQQGSTGPSNAIVVTSGTPKEGKRPLLPVINARKITPTNILPDALALANLSDTSPCAAERFETAEDSAYSLGSGVDGPRVLVLLNCGAGAYNFSSGIYTGRRDAGGAWTFEPAKFDYGALGLMAESNIPILVNANWDAATQTISSYAKARGLGDCGSSESYIWDGHMFRLTAASFMGECRGSTDWIPTWRAEVRLTN